MHASEPGGGPRSAPTGGVPGQAGLPTYPSGYAGASGQPGGHDAPSSQPTTESHRHHARASGGLPTRARRAGAGGRWWLWVGRAVLWALILVVVFNGVRAPFVRALQPTTSSSTTQQQTGYPRSAASAYALQFAYAYLDYQADTPQERAARLERYLPPDVDPQLGWNGSGSAELQAAHVAGVNARDAHQGVVTLAVLVGEKWMRLAVPIYADGKGAMAVTGQPALLPAPAEAALPPVTEPSTDADVAAELRQQLPGFFEAYAGGDTESLARYLAPGVSLRGFSGEVRFVALDDVVVPTEGGRTRQISATVTWQLLASGGEAGGKLQQTYQLTVSKQGGRWYVEDIGRASTRRFS